METTFFKMMSLGVMALAFGMNACKKDKNPIVMATITTGNIVDIVDVSAKVNYEINSTGGKINATGVCWGTTQSPTVDGNKTIESSKSTGNVVSEITGLTTGTIYYVRPYATNSAGTVYGDEKMFITGAKDASNNIYHSVKIGDQIWMLENLRTTKYNDNSDIDFVSGAGTWQSTFTGAYCWYNNTLDPNGLIYGALYNSYAVQSNKLAPLGWRIPTSTDWQNLITYLGGDLVAGGKLKETGNMHWKPNNVGATNDSGFTALPGGFRDGSGSFSNAETFGYYWSSTGINCFYLRGTDEKIIQDLFNAHAGLSVRCIK